MANKDYQEREGYINKLKAMGFQYNYERFRTDQLKNIYIKSMNARKAIIKDICDLGKNVGDRFNMTSLYNSHLNIDQLRGIKSRLKKENERLLLVNQIMELADFLGKDTNFISENMFSGHKTTEDLQDTLFKFQKELHELEFAAQKREDTIHYDASYAIGNDPILDIVDNPVIIPKEKVAAMVKTLDILKRRRKNKSLYLDKIPKKKYDRIMVKYHDLDKNYDYFNDADFVWLINFYNQAIDSLDEEYEEVDELAYTKHI